MFYKPLKQTSTDWSFGTIIIDTVGSILVDERGQIDCY